MPSLSLVYAPHPIFNKKAEPVTQVDDSTRQLVDAMFHTLYLERGVGLAAPMVGISQQIAIVDLQEDGMQQPYCFINPTITWYSEEKQTFTEASLSFPGISSPITRPNSIKIRYLDRDGIEKELSAEGFFATVIQHELDYLEGKTFLHYLSPLKREMLLKKMKKHILTHPPHVHTAHCQH